MGGTIIIAGAIGFILGMIVAFLLTPDVTTSDAFVATLLGTGLGAFVGGSIAFVQSALATHRENERRKRRREGILASITNELQAIAIAWGRVARQAKNMTVPEIATQPLWGFKPPQLIAFPRYSSELPDIDPKLAAALSGIELAFADLRAIYAQADAAPLGSETRVKYFDFARMRLQSITLQLRQAAEFTEAAIGSRLFYAVDDDRKFTVDELTALLAAL